MSLLDDFEILDAKADKACKEDTMSLFLHKFISSNINLVYPKNQIHINDFDVHLHDVKKCLNGKFEDASSPLWKWGDATDADITWDLSAWSDKDHNNVYIGYNYMYFPSENRRLLQFKLFNADEIIPNLNVEIEKDKLFRYSPIDFHQTYVNERYKNSYRGYKMLSLKTNRKSTTIGWLEFNMDLIMQLISTGWQCPDCDQIPSVYKVIPYGWDKKEMGEYVPKPEIGYTL